MRKFRFEELEVWRLAIEYGIEVYKLTQSFPKEELFGLSIQIKRASLSISSNIAEGSGGATVKDFCKYLDIAIKSTLETVSQLHFAYEMGYIQNEDMERMREKAEVIVKKTRGLKSYLNRPHPPTTVLYPKQGGHIA